MEPTNTDWKPRVPQPPAAPLSASLGLPRLIWEVMNARGFTTEESIKKWLSPTLKGLKDPFVLTDMDKAIKRLVEAREKQDAIVIYADYDLDGTSGLALFLKALEWMGFSNVTYYQPKRLSEGYGLHIKAIDKLYAEGRRLLVSIDLGITAIEEVKHANSLGMEVIITDHHLPKETLPAALAVINPNRGNCTSGLSHLCGTGVAFYMALALRRQLLELGVITEGFDPKALLDCFVIGTVTDMVPLIDENRVLVKHGLLQLAQTKRPGLRVLLQSLGLWGNPLTSQDVAIRFAPKLNALSRMELGVQPIDLYLIDDEKQARLLVEQVLSNNQTRQASQKSAEAEAMEYVEKNPGGSSVFVYSKNFHRGVVGLVATKLCQEFGLPAFVGSLSEETGQIVGSARMPDGRQLNALEAMSEAVDILHQFGGHAAAAGFELKLENAQAFRERLNTYFHTRLVQAQARTWIYDAEATLAELSPVFMNWYEHMSPFGVQFAPPIFYVQNVRVDQVRKLRGGHLRLTLAEADLTRVALWFSPGKDHALVSLGEDLNAASQIDALVEPQWNYFNGSRTLQLLVRDIRVSSGDFTGRAIPRPNGRHENFFGDRTP
jgi:single-stranded-DNA-specific exonuclease